ncbi:Type III pantothenate kinase [Kiritimatiella glycovorans]|uniref:Type III pantothenate kinase n=2 Tax=Kiritimatiella glycovorans TaxID=1307763 RepID=A0A0G3EE21_9BACT|nr:Type III pantothenate kinase [Kiritimatiella glycovorans]
MLVLDVGNTGVTAGRYRAGRVSRVRRRDTGRADAGELRAWLTPSGDAIRQAAYASVVPEVNPLWRDALAAAGFSSVLPIGPHLDLGVAVDYPRPETIGADRLANAAAAARRYEPPVVVCDFGTALTFDVILAEKGYVGGLICPGLPLMFEYLAERTALLPRIGPGRVSRVIGRSTVGAMRSGARLGARGMVREVIEAVRADLDAERLSVCATGGQASWICGDMDIEVDPHLTLRGLGIIGERNPDRFEGM